MNNTIHETLSRLKEIRYSAVEEDFTALSGELETSTEFQTLCLALAEEVVERETDAEAISLRIKELSERKARILHSGDMIRNLILQCMEIRGQSSITSPTLTLSKNNLKPDIVITDESLIPSEYFKPAPMPSPKLDKAALKEAIAVDGLVIDGVAMGNGKISLTIRRK